MPFGRCSSRQRPHDAVRSCRAPSVAREQPAPAARYGLNPKTVRKWYKRTTTADAPMGPKVPKSTVLTPAEEAIVVAFRQKTKLPLDDVLGCQRDTIPNFNSQSQPQRPAGRGGRRDAQAVQDLVIAGGFLGLYKRCGHGPHSVRLIATETAPRLPRLVTSSSRTPRSN